MFNSFSGATRIIPILGDPVAQTKAPAGMTLGFAKRGLDIAVIPLHVKPQNIAHVLQSLGTIGNLAGMLVTVPHKFAAFGFAASATPRARFFGSANVLRPMADGTWHADMLDGLGYIRAIGTAGGNIEGRRALLVGAGGAGSAIGLELLNAGAAHLAVYDANGARQAELLRKLNELHPGKASPSTGDPAGFEIVINATPLGLHQTDQQPLDFNRLNGGMFVGDVVTAAGPTPLIRAAGALGCTKASGHDMFHGTLDLMLDFFIAPQG